MDSCCVSTDPLLLVQEEYTAQSETIVRLRGVEASVESERALWEDKLSAAQAGRMEALQRVERMEQELRAGKQDVAVRG